MNTVIDFKRICPDCLMKKHIITHHIITKELMNYLITIGRYEKGSIHNLRNQLTVEICKDCEKKFHNDKIKRENAKLKKVINKLVKE